MVEEHKALPVAGYTPQSNTRVEVVNAFKRNEERLLRLLDGLKTPDASNETTNVFVIREPGDIRAYELTPGFADPRWLAVARTHFEQGFMALNRSIFQPSRVALPEDTTQ